jgi:hypothetical protein
MSWDLSAKVMWYPDCVLYVSDCKDTVILKLYVSNCGETVIPALCFMSNFSDAVVPRLCCICLIVERQCYLVMCYSGLHFTLVSFSKLHNIKK